jgi:putative hydrolase of HD superfamily
MTFMVIDELKLDVDINRSIKIALVHDLAESLTGDIDMIEVAEGRVSKEDKEKREIEAMKNLMETLPSPLGQDIPDLRHEYNN